MSSEESIKRYLDVQYRTSPRIKLTVNPNTGRVTVKLPHYVDDASTTKLAELATIALHHTFPPQTFRGDVYFQLGECYTTMYSDNRAKSVTLSTRQGTPQ